MTLTSKDVCRISFLGCVAMSACFARVALATEAPSAGVDPCDSSLEEHEPYHIEASFGRGNRESDAPDGDRRGWLLGLDGSRAWRIGSGGASASVEGGLVGSDKDFFRRAHFGFGLHWNSHGKVHLSRSPTAGYGIGFYPGLDHDFDGNTIRSFSVVPRWGCVLLGGVFRLEAAVPIGWRWQNGSSDAIDEVGLLLAGNAVFGPFNIEAGLSFISMGHSAINDVGGAHVSVEVALARAGAFVRLHAMWLDVDIDDSLDRSVETIGLSVGFRLPAPRTTNRPTGDVGPDGTGIPLRFYRTAILRNVRAAVEL